MKGFKKGNVYKYIGNMFASYEGLVIECTRDSSSGLHGNIHESSTNASYCAIPCQDRLWGHERAGWEEVGATYEIY